MSSSSPEEEEEANERRQHHQRPPGSALKPEEQRLAEIEYQKEPYLRGRELKAFVIDDLKLKEKDIKIVSKWFERRRKKDADNGVDFAARSQYYVAKRPRPPEVGEASTSTTAPKSESPPRKQQRSQWKLQTQAQSYDEPAVCTFELGKYEKIAETALQRFKILRILLLTEPQTATSLWSPPPLDHIETPILNEVEYQKTFGTSRGYSRHEYKLRESSGLSREVCMDATELALMLTKSHWSSLFPSIVLNSSIIQGWATGSARSPNGSMQLMFNEIHVPSPVVPTRKYTFLRTCTKLGDKFYDIVDTSMESMNHLSHPVNCHRLPSGCFIQGVREGVSLVTWIEHSEPTDQLYTHSDYKDVVLNSLAYNAMRWLTSLQHSCERIRSCSRLKGTDISFMKVSEMMVKQFYKSLKPSAEERPVWVTELEVKRLTIQARIVSTNDSMVARGYCTVYLPNPVAAVFKAVEAGKTQHSWASPGMANQLEVLKSYATDDKDPRNKVSLSKVIGDKNQREIQEAAFSPCESYLVWGRVEDKLISSSTHSGIFRGLNGFTITRTPSRETVGPSTHLLCASEITLMVSMHLPHFDKKILNSKMVEEAMHQLGEAIAKMMTEMTDLIGGADGGGSGGGSSGGDGGNSYGNAGGMFAGEGSSRDNVGVSFTDEEIAFLKGLLPPENDAAVDGYNSYEKAVGGDRVADDVPVEGSNRDNHAAAVEGSHRDINVESHSSDEPIKLLEQLRLQGNKDADVGRISYGKAGES